MEVITRKKKDYCDSCGMDKPKHEVLMTDGFWFLCTKCWEQ